MADDTVQVRITAETSGLDQLSAKLGKTKVDLSAFGEAARAQITAAMGLGQASVQAGSGLTQLGAAAQTAEATVGHGMEGMRLATAGTTREFIVLGHEALTGNFSRIPGSIMVLMERMGNLHTVVASLAGPFGAALAAAGALGVGLFVLASQAHQAELAMRGVYNASLLMGGRGAASQEAAANVGAIAMRSSGLMSRATANDIAAEIQKLGTASDETKRKLMELGPAMYWQQGKDAKETIKELNDAFGRGVPGMRRWAEEHGAVSKEMTTEFLNAEKANNSIKLQGMLLDFLTARLSGAKGAIKDAGKAAEDMALSMAQSGAAPTIPISPNMLLPPRIPEGTPAGADPAAMADQMHKIETVGERIHEQMARLNADVASHATNVKTAREQMLKADVNYLTQALKTEEMTDHERANLTIELFHKKEQLSMQELRMGAGASKKSYEDFAAAERLKIQEAKGDSDKINQIYEEWKARAKAQFGEASKEYQTVERERVRATQQANTEIFHEQMQAFSAAERIDNLYLRAFEKNMEAMAVTHKISKEQGYGFDIQYTAQLHAEERKRLEDMISNDNFTEAEKSELYNKLMELDAQYESRVEVNQAKIQEAMQRTSDKIAQPFVQAFDQIGSAFESAIAGMISGTMTWQKAMQNVFSSVISGFTKMIGEMISQWAASGLASMLGVSVGSGTGVGGVLGKVVGGLFGAAIGSIFGPAGAAEGAAVGAGTGGLYAQGGIVPSAAKGWAVPSFANGGIPSILHPNEMVLPANISQGLQNMIAGGGAGGPSPVVNFSVSAMDSQDVAKFFRGNGSALVGAINAALRNGSQLRTA